MWVRDVAATGDAEARRLAGNDAAARERCADVMQAFFAAGGRLIDSSPMYGSSQPVIGHALAKLGRPAALFSAEKVWVGDVSRGAAQMEASRSFWGVPRFDLMQVHNLLGWEEHTGGSGAQGYPAALAPAVFGLQRQAQPQWFADVAHHDVRLIQESPNQREQRKLN